MAYAGAPRAARPRSAPIVRITSIAVQFRCCMELSFFQSRLERNGDHICPVCDAPKEIIQHCPASISSSFLPDTQKPRPAAADVTGL
jgi:hypothetical protein